MGRHVTGSRRAWSGFLSALLVASSLFFQNSFDPSVESAQASGLAAETVECNAGAQINTMNFGSFTSAQGLKIQPLHTKVLYIDPRNGFDATYIGYRISNDSSTPRTNLYVGLEFTDPLIQPVSAADTKRHVSLAAKSGNTVDSKVIYFMIRATNTSDSTDIRHQVRLFDGDPSVNGSRLDGCFNRHRGIQRSIAASPNKVNSIETNASTLSLGQTFTVTVRGVPGNVGAGNSVDGSVFALSPAVNKAWPTKAIRLERVQLDVSGAKPGNGCNLADTSSSNNKTAQWVDKLAIGKASDCFAVKSSYVATYTFRVIGAAATNPVVRPYASIASGTQIKYTGTLPTAQVSLPLNSVSVPITVTKTYDNTFTPIVVAGTSVTVQYKITVASTQNVSINQVRDVPSPSGTFVSGTFTDASVGSTSITPVSTSGNLVFSTNSFTITSGTPLVITYRMSFPLPAAGQTASYSNQAFALYDQTLVGSGANITGVELGVDSNGAVTAILTANALNQPQTITFDPPATIGTGLTTDLFPTADSGLDVALTSADTSICTVAKVGGVWKVTGVAVGNCQLTASQGGGSGYDPAANVVRTIQVLAGQTIQHSVSAFVSNVATLTLWSSVNNSSSVANLEVLAQSLDTTICTLTSKTYPVGDNRTTYTLTRLTTAGSCPLFATQAGDSTYSPAEKDILLSFGTPQTIRFLSPAPSVLLVQGTDARFSVSALSEQSGTSTAAQLPIQFKSQTPAVCDVRLSSNADGEISGYVNSAPYATTVSVEILSAGTCTIAANQNGFDDNGNLSTYASADQVLRSFTIEPNNYLSLSTQTIEFATPADRVYGDNSPVEAGSYNGGSATNLTVTFTSQTPGVCSAGASSIASGTSSATITLHSAGTCTLEATQGGNGSYRSATPVQRSFVVTPKQLTLSGLSATKVYNAALNVVFQGSASLNGVVSPDGSSEIDLTGTPTGVYADKNVGANKDITVSGLSLVGSKASSYTLADYTIYGSITQRPLVVTYNGGQVSPTANVTCLAGSSADALQGGDVLDGATCTGIPAKDQNGNTAMALGTYTVTISAVTITSNSADVTGNYSITFVDGQLVVTGASYTLTYADSFNPGLLPQDQTGVGSLTLAGPGTMSRSGYVFAGWLIDSVTYSAGASYNLQANKTATAAWTLITYTITYLGGGNTGGSAPTPTVGVGSVSLASAGSLTKNGFDFVGWDIGGTEYLASANYNLQADVNATALWTASSIVVQTPTPTQDPAPAPTEPAPPKLCTPQTENLSVESGLVGVIGRLFSTVATGLSSALQFLLVPVLNSPFGSALVATQPVVSNPLLGGDTLGNIETTTVGQLFKAGSPKPSTTLDPATIQFQSNNEGELTITGSNGDELTLLGADFIDYRSQTTYSGSDFNNPLTWQKLGYGTMCWKLEPFTDADYFFTLPDPIKLPAGAAAGEWEYSNVMVKAGSITATSDTYQTDTVFAAPKPGDRVFADINANGIFDPGGKNGDKAISHIIICAKLKTTAPTPQATQSPTVSPTPTVTPTSSPTPTVTPTASPTPTPTVEPTVTPTPTITPEPLKGEDCIWPEPTSSPQIVVPSPTPTPTVSGIVLKLDPSQSPVITPPGGTNPPGGSNPGTPPVLGTNPALGPVIPGTPVTMPFSADTSTPCSATQDYGVALLLSNGTSSLCFRTTSLALFNLAFAPFQIEDEPVFTTQEEEEAEEPVVDSLADTGFDFGLLALLAMLMAGAGFFSLRLSRRRD